jgi:hypothetical protein
MQPTQTKLCEVCKGTGMKVCSACQGRPTADGKPCWKCSGRGGSPCQHCNTTGHIKVTHPKAPPISREMMAELNMEAMSFLNELDELERKISSTQSPALRTELLTRRYRMCEQHVAMLRVVRAMQGMEETPNITKSYESMIYKYGRPGEWK